MRPVSPEAALMREGLARGTFHLPRASGKRMNTIDAITTGIVVIAPYIRQEFDNVDIRHNLVLHGLSAFVRIKEPSALLKA